MTQIICGVDVSSETLDAQVGQDGRYEQFARTAEGIAALAAFCRQNRVELVVMEATGGYEKLPFALLWAEGLPGAIVNPRAVRDFAKAMGRPEKTDRLDAGIIAWYAQVKGIVAQAPASPAQQQLQALVIRLRQLTQAHTVHKNQRRLVGDPAVLALIDEVIALFKRQMREIEQTIAGLFAADPLWHALDQAFRQIKGVADRSVARLMAELPEIGTISNKAIAKLVGVAPIAKDSGKHKGRRPIRGGRAPSRGLLFTIAEIVRRHVPDFAEFHQRLSQAGKAKKVIRIALAHKLLVRLNAKARDARQQLALAA